jgi:RsiW-degrading membrane proteinase PrsW (M82 family)
VWAGQAPYGAPGVPPGYFPPPKPRSSFPSPAVLLPFQHWLRDKSLRNWITVVFVGLVVIPSITLVLFGNDLNHTTQSAWVFAVYFASAWLLVLWIAVRPPLVKPLMLAEVAAIGLVLEAPLAVWLETSLNSQTNNIFQCIFTVGVPEEFVKALPIAVLAIIHRKWWRGLTPKDYLFLGAVSGLGFGAAEAVEYVTKVIPALVTQQVAEGLNNNTLTAGGFVQLFSSGSDEVAWRFVTDPMSHAVWAGITGYFIGLAVRFARHRVWLALFGLGLTALLHGINDYVAQNTQWWWILEIIVSVLLFVAYAQAGGSIEQILNDAELAAHVAPQMGWGPPMPPPVPGAPPVQAYVPTSPATGYHPGQGWSAPVQQAPAWNPAAGWGSSGFTPLPGYQQPRPAPPQSGGWQAPSGAQPQQPPQQQYPPQSGGQPPQR